MNMNLKLDLDMKKLLPVLRQAQGYIFGLALIGVFGYTAYVVNAAINVKPAAAPVVTAGGAPTAKVTFNKATIESLKKLDVVQGNVPTGDLGKDDPFK